MLKLLSTIGHRLSLLWHGDAELQLRLDASRAALEIAQKINVKNAVRLHDLSKGLVNITSHAQHALDHGQPGVFVEALRDYSREVLRGWKPGLVAHNTDGVTAASRWGYDFTAEPWEERETPRKVTH